MTAKEAKAYLADDGSLWPSVETAEEHNIRKRYRRQMNIAFQAGMFFGVIIGGGVGIVVATVPW